uniref:GmrSD restriction endonuclease domain-containing protein n=1 Tax=Vibrio alfacsensis TaxID=1074311 RepID=UPI003AB1AC6A
MDDIYQSYLSDEKEYFIGSMICINKGNNTFEVVDGQQRLTTLSLIVSELKLIDHQGVKTTLKNVYYLLMFILMKLDEPRLVVRKKNTTYINSTYYKIKEYKPENLLVQNSYLLIMLLL